jgi:GntR family transcriptional regulator, transcriptional repressor for pyruvate dehydrogenase complex
MPSPRSRPARARNLRAHPDDTSGPSALSRRTFTDQVAEAILKQIRDRGLRQGDTLPPTAEMAAAFGVSRPVIREALAELAGRGLIDRQQGRESVLRLPGSEHIAQLLDYRVEHTDITDAQLHELRKTLELQSARLAALNATSEDIADLERWLAALREAVRDVEASLTADIAIHRGVAVATRNPLFVLILDALGPLLLESRRRAWQSYRSHGGQYEEVIGRHDKIVSAVVGRDPDAAEAAMAADLVDLEELLERRQRKRRVRGTGR